MDRFDGDRVISEIIARVDIVDLISEYVVLAKKGKDYWALCPFHNEDTPSFSVSPEKQLFYCFGCQTGGNVITFLRRKENLTYAEAVSRLAERAGISLKGSRDLAFRQKSRGERERFLQVNAKAAEFFHQQLLYSPEAEEARQYLVQRGITSESMEAFCLGFSPPGWDTTLNFMVRQGFSPGELERSGLVVSRTAGGGYYDRFRGRLMFPIWDATGQVVGFGGRSLRGEEPKYLNSPENRYFEKGKLLYALYHAREAIRHTEQIIVVEGYMDAIRLHQSGIKNVVASMGTALGLHQVQLLLRYAREVVLAYDNDEAGHNAALKAAALLKQHRGRVRVLLLPEGKDPDEFVQLKGGEAFRALLGQTHNALSFELKLLLNRIDFQTTAGKQRVLDEFFPSFQQTESELERQEAIWRLAQAFRLPEDTIRKELGQRWRQARKTRQLDKNTNPVHNKNGKLMAWERAERQLVRLMLEEQEVARSLLQRLQPVDFVSPEAQAFIEDYKYILADSGAEQPLSFARLIEICEGKPYQSWLLEITMQESSWLLLDERQKEKAVNDCVRMVMEEQKRRKLKQLNEELIAAYREGDLERGRAIEKERQRVAAAAFGDASSESSGRGEKR